VVDLGAHIGVFTIFASKSGAFVYSYEPEPTNFIMNVKLNNLNSKVKTFQMAVADKKGNFPLHVSELGIASLVGRNAGSVFVEAISLEDILVENKLPKIDFLKVDVEGAEWSIFSTTKKSVLTKIRKIAMECHSVKDAARLKRLLEEADFSVQVAPGGHPTLVYIYAENYSL
jgi:FkbM family methyltransferase